MAVVVGQGHAAPWRRTRLWLALLFLFPFAVFLALYLAFIIFFYNFCSSSCFDFPGNAFQFLLQAL